jgi:hypothetical protein
MQRSRQRERDESRTGHDGAERATGDAPAVGLEGRYLSGKALAAAGVALAAGSVLGGFVPLIGTLGSAAGLFAAAFLSGVAFARRRYPEVGVAGAAVGALTAVTGTLTAAFLPIGLDVLAEYGIGLAAVGGGVGLALALLGHYLGRDLRAGLTREVG